MSMTSRPDALRESLRVACTRIAALLPAELCTIWLLSGAKLILNATNSDNQDLLGALHYDITEPSILSRTAEMRETFVVREPREIPYADVLEIYPEGHFEVAAVPIVQGADLLGVLRIWRQGEPITHSVVALLREMTAHVAEIIEASRWPRDATSQLYDACNIDIQFVSSLNEALLSRLRAKPEALYELNPRLFEELLAELLYRDGWSVELSAMTRDHGYDIIAVRNLNGIGVKLLVQAKRYARTRPVGVAEIRQLWTVKTRAAATKALLATTSYVSRPARKEFHTAIPWELDIAEYDQLVSWLQRVDKRRS